MIYIRQLVKVNNFIESITRYYATQNQINRLNFWNILRDQTNNKDNKRKEIFLISVNVSNSVRKVLSDDVTPLNFIPKSEISSTLISSVNGHGWDTTRPLISDCDVQYLNFSHTLGREAFWRSTAFIVSGVIEACFETEAYRVNVDENGFYCDVFIKHKHFSPADFPIIEEKYNAIVALKAPFERLEVAMSTAREIYHDNIYKLAYLSSKCADSEHVTMYKCADFVDICQSPLVMHSGQLKVLKLTWNGALKSPVDDDENALQRIYGISFPSKDVLKQWQDRQEEAKKRDHRRIGQQQKLFFFHSSSSGSPFMLPRGTHICNKLMELVREQYRERGFEEVTTPNMFDCELWKTSGHWDLYQENLFKIPLDNDRMMSLKPMNCPAHCLIYAHEERSSSDLPLRLADFGALHRNESSGALSGLTRLRKFHQDDAHIFCRPDQIEHEIKASLDFLQHIYDVLGFKYSLSLSTRPDKFLGETSMWDLAEQQLKDCLDAFGSEWTLNPGDGAFYGPKIDITITDAMNRDHQCATIQLDFQLPQRFGLKYTIDRQKGSCDTPVIIHRAILGSVERLLAIMIESNCGRWPFWLNPRQVLVVPVSRQFNDAASRVCSHIRAQQFMCDVDVTDERTFNRKIRLGQVDQYNCILVLGDQEVSSGTVALRTRDGLLRGSYGLADLVAKFSGWRTRRTLRIEDDF